jgi:hypothetical protein
MLVFWQMNASQRTVATDTVAPKVTPIEPTAGDFTGGTFGSILQVRPM